MGRKKDVKELSKRGPGRKAKKQRPPELPVDLKGAEASVKTTKTIGGRIRQRARKRVAKAAMRAFEAEQKRQAKGRKKKTALSAQPSEAIESDGKTGAAAKRKSAKTRRPQLFSDDNQSWLKPVTPKVVLSKRYKEGAISDGSEEDKEWMGKGYSPIENEQSSFVCLLVKGYCMTVSGNIIS